MSGVNAARQGFVTKSALPSITRQRGPVAYACSLLINGNGTNGTKSPIVPVDATGTYSFQRVLTPYPVNLTPYWPDGQWSNYFNGSSHLAAPAGAAFAYGTGDFTVEGWFYSTAALPAYTANILSQTVSGTNYFICALGDNQATPAQKVSFIFATSGGGTTITSGATTFVNNTWNHFAIVRSSGVVTVYLNGVGGTPTACTQDFSNTTYAPTIGRYTHTASNYFTGYLSNLRVVKGTALYTADFTPSTSPLTAVSGTSLLACQSNRFKDNSSNNFAITVTGTPSVLPAAPFTPPANPASYGGSIYQTGTARQTYYSNPLSITTGEFCIESWFYPENFSANRKLLSNKAWSTGYNKGFEINVTTAGKVQLNASQGSWNSFPQVIISTASLIANAWNHVVLCRDSSNTLRIFINGVADASVTYTQSLDQSVSGFGAHYFTIGNDYGDGQFGSLPFNGYIGDVRVSVGTGSATYTAAFTPPTSKLTPTTGTVLAASSSAFVVESGTNNLPVVPAGNVNQTIASPFGASYPGSLSFDGVSGSQVAALYGPAYNFGTGNFTIEGWVRTTSTTQDRGVFSRLASGAGRFVLQVSPGQGLWFWSSEINGGMSAACINTTVVTDGNWHHFAVVRNGTLFTLYVDGVAGSTTATTSAALGASTAPVYIGNDISTPSSRTWLGNIANLRIVTGTAIYTANFTPPTTPLTAVTGTTLLLPANNIGISDTSANGYSIGLAGDTQISTAQSKFGGSSIRLDGTGGYMTIANATPLQLSVALFQIECWVYRSATGVVHTVAAKGGSTTGWMLQINASDKLTFTVSSSVVMTSTSSIAANTWVHIAITRDINNLMRMFVNGTQEASVTNSTTFTQTEVLIIGADRSYANFFNGYIDDFRMFRDGVEYIADFTAPTDELTANDACYRLVSNTVYGVYQTA